MSGGRAQTPPGRISPRIEPAQAANVARVRAIFIPALRAKVFERFHKLEIKTCPSNLLQRDKGRWGQGLTADKMAECRWLKPLCLPKTSSWMTRG